MLVATVLALSSAGLHAAWNLILKTADHEDRDLAIWGQMVAGGVLALPVLLFVGWPGTAAFPWLMLSSTINLGYATALVGAYRAGDFSLTYPFARGGGALVAAFGGVLLLGDHLPAAAWLAIAVVMVGLVSLVGRQSRRGRWGSLWPPQ